MILRRHRLKDQNDRDATTVSEYERECRLPILGRSTLTRATGETTNGAFGMIEHWEMPLGFASPYHTHHREDEGFYVLEGRVAFVCGGEWLEAGSGAFVYGPRDIAHGFNAIGERRSGCL